MKSHADVLGATLALLLVGTAAQAQDGYAGWEYRHAQGTSNWNDPWGNRWGNSYAASANYSGPDAGLLTWSGQGSHSTSGPVANFVTTPETVSFRSDSAGSWAGDTYSGGEMSLPGTQAFPGVVTSRFHLYSVLGDHGDRYTSTYGILAGNFHTTASDNPYAPLYYRIDWTVQTSGDAQLAASVMFARGEETYHLAAGSGSIVGVLGPEYYAYPGTGLRRPFDLNTSAGAGGGQTAMGRVDLWATLTLSQAPLPPVPEPGTWALMLGGVAALGAWRRRATMLT
ncbi:MAG: PEP-CTERM sorting domain-containing protein [Rubrivivax sp.]|nr:PEP-CTERM sorting domain-containing protein [Rubrivivax sp.]